MEWPNAQELGVGGTLALAALALTFKAVWTWKKSGNGHRAVKSGELDPADWEQRISRIINEAIDNKFEIVTIQREEKMQDMLDEHLKQVFASRNDELRRLIREELQYFYGLKGGIRR